MLTYSIRGQNATMTSLVAQLGEQLNLPVIDHSDLKGGFNFRLEFAADPAQADGSPSLFTAIQEQLGLKLDSTKGPINTLAIDHAEKPSEN